ncbi:phage tail protein [Klebsiella aerogenes]|uniref:phage tail protein n=2 Tax=Klebsiella aerogenes TaxID=548 RepID=UPI0018694480|nr:phage tail protein [Klebsiella aerogenes]WFW28728.1 phage tail protein [Klebsiella aerogenes]
MAGKKYTTLLTPAGEAKLAEAALTGEPVGFAFMAVGDGGGESLPPDTARQDLINEIYRAPLNRLVIADQAANVVRAELVILPQVGGFWIREAALYNDDGVCLAVANLPESYKPQLSEGAGRMHAVNLWIAVSNTADVELKADPTVILATVDEVNKAKDEAKDYADQVVGDLDTSIQQVIAEAITAARRDFWEEENPPGTVRFFAQNVDPNEKWPWSQWTYTGENKTIRVGKADGSDVGSNGGQDEITLAEEHLPPHKHRVKGKTQSFHFERIETEDAGEHSHEFPLTGDASNTGMADGGDPAKQDGTQRTSTQPAHRHGVNIPDHGHDIDFESESAGGGKSFSIVEAHTLLMCWARVA